MSYSLARDLIRYDRELAQQDADEEYREGIVESMELITALLPILSECNLKSIRSAAQDIMDDCNRRLP